MLDVEFYLLQNLIPKHFEKKRKKRQTKKTNTANYSQSPTEKSNRDKMCSYQPIYSTWACGHSNFLYNKKLTSCSAAGTNRCAAFYYANSYVSQTQRCSNCTW